MYKFSKMHGAGNDFIIIDQISDLSNKQYNNHSQSTNGKEAFSNNAITEDFIKNICHRTRGIGADGVIFLSALSHSKADIAMKFYNSDGSTAEMCGNGLRCVALFTHMHISNKREIIVKTDAGELKTKIISKNLIEIEIPIKKDAEKIIINNTLSYFANSGVPHLTIFCDNVDDIDILKEGKYYRNHSLFKPNGVNVNFISMRNRSNNQFSIRTYERGVENETSACGTGIAASALAISKKCNNLDKKDFLTNDNDLISVEFPFNENIVQDNKKVLLQGPALEVYKGFFDPNDFIGVIR